MSGQASQAGFDPDDLAEFRGFLEKRGLTPVHFDLQASPAEPGEGELGPSSRIVTLRHAPSGITRTYGFRTWVEDFKSDVGAGVFNR